ncbi:MAG: response regulator [Phycisphaerales bacterium JB039]
MQQTTKTKARSKQWTILIIDDHPLVRRGVRDALSDEPDLEVVAEAADVAEGLRKAADAPDLAIVDISLGHGSGLDLIKQLRAQHPDIKILVLSVHDEALYAERALRAGAQGYLRKSEPADTLIAAIRSVLRGGAALSPVMTERLVRQAVHNKRGEASGVESLSDREMEVFQLIGGGLSTRKIAKQLCISIKTVETHREHIKRKLGIDTAAELSRYAVAWVENPS